MDDVLDVVTWPVAARRLITLAQEVRRDAVLVKAEVRRLFFRRATDPQRRGTLMKADQIQ
jgi:hypothetical protein